LIITREGISQVKKVKIKLLNSQYDSFYMLDDETIDSTLTRIPITNDLISLGKPISNDQMERDY